MCSRTFSYARQLVRVIVHCVVFYLCVHLSYPRSERARDSAHAVRLAVLILCATSCSTSVWTAAASCLATRLSYMKPTSCTCARRGVEGDSPPSALPPSSLPLSLSFHHLPNLFRIRALPRLTITVIIFRLLLPRSRAC